MKAWESAEHSTSDRLGPPHPETKLTSGEPMPLPPGERVLFIHEDEVQRMDEGVFKRALKVLFRRR